MKTILKIEELALFTLFTSVYFYLYPGLWIFFVAMFFVPDCSFAVYLISSKAGAIGYNLLHHKGVMALTVLLGLYFQSDVLVKTGLIFLAHSSFDRIFGYGLKYYDNFSHTHLGWIGKQKLNPPTM